MSRGEDGCCRRNFLFQFVLTWKIILKLRKFDRNVPPLQQTAPDGPSDLGPQKAQIRHRQRLGSRSLPPAMVRTDRTFN